MTYFWTLKLYNFLIIAPILLNFSMVKATSFGYILKQTETLIISARSQFLMRFCLLVCKMCGKVPFCKSGHISFLCFHAPLYAIEGNSSTYIFHYSHNWVNCSYVTKFWEMDPNHTCNSLYFLVYLKYFYICVCISKVFL